MTRPTLAEAERKWAERENELCRQIDRLTEQRDMYKQTSEATNTTYSTIQQDNTRLRKELEAVKGHEIEAARLRGKLEVYEAMYPTTINNEMRVDFPYTVSPDQAMSMARADQERRFRR